MNVALLLVLLHAAPSRAPDKLALPGFRLHLIASEDLDPDRLRPFARERVVLWLKTRTNLLRHSTVENVARFRTALVQLRPPLSESAVHQLDRAKAAGAWLEEAGLGGEGLHRLGPRAIAVDAAGPLSEERWTRLVRAKPRWLRLTHAEPLDAAGWSRLRQLSMWRTIRQPAATTAPCDRPAPSRSPRVEVSLSEPHLPCGVALLARVEGAVTDEALRALYRVDPSAELQVDIGSDDRAALQALTLLRRLEEAIGEGPPRFP